MKKLLVTLSLMMIATATFAGDTHSIFFTPLNPLVNPTPGLNRTPVMPPSVGFKTNEMAILMNTSEQSVSNARARAVKRLFDSHDTTLLDTRLPEI